jgi:hypothetical protein
MLTANEMRDHRIGDTHSSAVAPQRATHRSHESAMPHAPAGQVPSQEGEGGQSWCAIQQARAPLDLPSQEGDSGHASHGNHSPVAAVENPAQAGEGANHGAQSIALSLPQPNPRKGLGKALHGTPLQADVRSPSRNNSADEADTGEAVHCAGDLQATRDRFAAPLIAEVTEIWRQRQDMVRAQQKLTLQAKAVLRRFTRGDKGEAEKLWKAITTDGEHPLAAHAGMAILPLRLASEPLEKQRRAYELHLGKMGKRLPVAHMADQIKGINHGTLARMVAEIGEFTAYEKGIAGIWKRAGLAVIDGERQRKKSGDDAIRHGYAPERHAVFWNVAQALLKAQGTGEAAGPYRLIYDARKAYERPRVETDGHAHNRAMRFMLKRLLKDIWREWKEVVK